MKRNLLLISNSTNSGEEYFAWPRPYIENFLKKFSVRSVLFIPFAGVNLDQESIYKSYDVYENRVKGIFADFGVDLFSIHHSDEPRQAVKKAECIVVGGGNTFHLVKMMHETGIMKTIKEQVNSGIPYAGWSAGANVACPTMQTTNDMPITEPQSFGCLGLIPFQINPHYLDANPLGHAGETREQRLLEYLTVNRDITVAGLREGCLLWIEGNSVELKGNRSMRVFRYGQEPIEYTEGSPLDFLMKD
ncbi:MAG: dipeptidase PepE [Bacteroidetes bacterium]|nr:dipeptidase PepE [Bacteroidota bacterium]